MTEVCFERSVEAGQSQGGGYPSLSAIAMSAKCQKRTSGRLFDHLVGDLLNMCIGTSRPNAFAVLRLMTS